MKCEERTHEHTLFGGKLPTRRPDTDSMQAVRTPSQPVYIRRGRFCGTCNLRVVVLLMANYALLSLSDAASNAMGLAALQGLATYPDNS